MVDGLQSISVIRFTDVKKRKIQITTKPSDVLNFDIEVDSWASQYLENSIFSKFVSKSNRGSGLGLFISKAS
jgi:nitrogen-specific signal transduction histidine kinase